MAEGRELRTADGRRASWTGSCAADAQPAATGRKLAHRKKENRVEATYAKAVLRRPSSTDEKKKNDNRRSANTTPKPRGQKGTEEESESLTEKLHKSG